MRLPLSGTDAVGGRVVFLHQRVAVRLPVRKGSSSSFETGTRRRHVAFPFSAHSQVAGKRCVRLGGSQVSAKNTLPASGSL